MNITADLHVHTIVSSHAYSTILENAKYASDCGMTALAITDHGPDIEDGAHFWHFWNQDVIPKELFGVKIIKGVEANIISKNGDLDSKMPEFVYDGLDWVIASIHGDGSNWDMDNIKQDVTNAYLKVLDKPYVDCIGHSGTERFVYDYEKVIEKTKKLNKVIEINNNSFFIRKGSKINCRQIALLCKKHRTFISVDSDAHFAYQIGVVNEAMKMLEEIDFPKELIINLNDENLKNYFEIRKNRINMIGV